MLPLFFYRNETQKANPIDYSMPTFSNLLAVVLLTIKISMNSIGFLLNCLLLRLIFKNHHKLHTTFSILFTYTLINDTLMSVTVLLTVRRIVQCHETVAAVYYGPCTLVSTRFCRVLENTHMFSLQNWILSQSLLILFRMAMLSARSSLISVNKTLFCCLLAWLPGICTLVWQLSYNYSSERISELLGRCTDEDFTHVILSGYESVYNSPLPVVIALLLIPNIPYYILFGLFHKKQIHEMKRETMSSRTLRMHATLRKISTAKAFLPILLLIDVLIYVFCQMELLPIALSEYFTGTLSSSINILNPMIAISCFRPYQRKFQELYKNMKVKITIPSREISTRYSEEVHL